MSGPSVPYGLLRRVSIAEGCSFLLLLGVAMPLKYLADWPAGVRVVGMVHGILFIALLLTLAYAWARGLPSRWALVGVVAAVLPFGPFIFERRLAATQPTRAEA